MKIPWIKLVAGAVAVEIAAILALVLVVAIFGPNTATGAQAYAEKMGLWVGPIAGAAFSFLGAFWIARRLPKGQIAHGALFGLCVALVDVSLLVAMQASFEWLFVLSDAGKILAGIAGGLVAAQCCRGPG